MPALLTIALLSAGWVLYAYVGYPLGLWLLKLLAPRPVRAADVYPAISVIIAVHNGARELAAKLTNTLGLDYPGTKEVIVSSDGSTDDSVGVASAFKENGVVVLAAGGRAGKEAAQRLAITQARGDILIFTDVSAMLAPDALSCIVRPFADTSIGAVSSEDALDSMEGEGAYVRFEMALRRLETQAATLVGLSGSFFAVRRELAEDWPVDLASDFRSALEAARRGLRAISEPGARAFYKVAADPAAEWARKVRTVRRGLAVLSSYRDLLHPRYGRAAFALWGHKVARFTSPLALVLLFLSSALGASQSGILGVAFFAQLGGYGLGLATLALPALSHFLVPRLAAFFVVVNASMVVAWVHHLSGERAVLWTPTER